LKVALATGGESVSQQRRAAQQADILVATPGRLLQFVDERSLILNNSKNKQGSVKMVIVDEADRMLDMGFEPQLQRIARALGRHSVTALDQSNNTEDRVTVLCSATFPLAVQRLASTFLKPNYYFVAAGKVGETNNRISQEVLWSGNPNGNHKPNIVVENIEKFLQSAPPSQRQVVVFTNTKQEADRLGEAIMKSLNSKNGAAARSNTRVSVVTGDKSQAERNKSLENFRSGRIDILVATDIAARGLDVPSVGLVIQADAPRDVDTFVHRVGRTGRAGAKGMAIAILDGRSMGIANDLVDLLRAAEQPIPAWLLGMSYIAKARSLEEEGAIAAGSGAGLFQVPDTDNSKVVENDKFSAQDFRRSAEEGSWGAQRDTSYKAFDDEAYSEFDPSAISVGEVNEYGDQNSENNQEAKEEMQRDFQEANTAEPIMAFKRENPSKKLSIELEKINGGKEIGDTPNEKALSALSRRGSDQRLHFEYLGMFQFEHVAEHLMARERSKAGRGNSGTIESGLPRVLMVAEKPSIATAIAEALSRGRNGFRQRRGISRALPVYEFTTDAPFLGNGTSKAIITVTSVVGHVFSLGFVEDRNETRPKDPSEYFHLPVVKQEEESTGKLRVVDHLRALAADSDHLVLWLDCDAEGENIAHEVIGVTRRAIEQKAAEEMAKDPDALPVRRIHRARFSAITKQALHDAFGKLVEPDAELSRSVDARQELDLRVGVALTRLLSWRFVGLARRKFSPATRVISYGPCQTPTLSFCVDRALEIRQFNPEKYWKLHVDVKTGTGKQNLKWKVPSGSVINRKSNMVHLQKSERLQERPVESASCDFTVVDKVASLASANNARARIAKITEKAEKIEAPTGLNTVALLKAGSKAMGLSPKQMMNVAEKLYSSGFISYPRTETTMYDPNGFNVRSILKDHSSHPEWGKTAGHLLRTKYAKTSVPPRRGYDAGDHPPITSLKAATREEVGGGQAWRVYDFITRHFLGSLGDNLCFTRRIAELQIDGVEDYDARFELEEVSVDSLGFAGACSWVLRDIGASRNKQEESKVLKEGMTMPIERARCEECSTQPPNFLQEHELIELMDKNRIGTDASMAAHVNNIVSREYVVLCDETGLPLRPHRPPRPGQKPLPRQIGRYLVPTSLGMALIDMLRNGMSPEGEENEHESPALLSRPGIRAQMENEVKLIADGVLDKSECLEKNLAWFESRYGELSNSLSRERTQEVAGSLRPTRDSLREWKRLSVFEAAKNDQNGGGGGGQYSKKGSKKGRNPNFQRFNKGSSKKNRSNPKGVRKAVSKTPGTVGRSKTRGVR